MGKQMLAQNINFGYDDKKIIEDVSLDLEQGKFVSIIGPNGSGKTTLMKTLAASLRPDTGVVLLDGSNIHDLNSKERARNISFVPQNTSFEFDFKVSDVVLMGRYPHQKSFQAETDKDREIADKAMVDTNVYQFADKFFSQLSGGEKQRVILAQALCQEPKILMLDEPISQLDLYHQIEMLTIIRRLVNETQLSVVAILHDINIASLFSDRILLLKNGEIFKEGTPKEVITADTIRDVFQVKVYTMDNEKNPNSPYIFIDYTYKMDGGKIDAK